MQISDLNKIVNLFLVGALAQTIFSLLWIDSIQRYVSAYASTGSQLPSSLAVLLGSLMALASAMFVGAVIDGLTETFLRDPLRKVARSGLVRKFFLVNQQYLDTEGCQLTFNELWSRSTKYESIRRATEKDSEIFASALFFRTAESSNISWVVQHHAVHVLAADYIFLVLVLTIALPVLSLLGSFVSFNVRTLPFGWWLLFLLSLYPLCHLALHRWLYTYEVAYRHGVLVLSEEAVERSKMNNASTS
jgi:hypothetical protein